MKTPLLLIFAGLVTLEITPVTMLTVRAANPLFLAYPPDNYQTTSETIFIIGNAPPSGEVSINGQVIKRSQNGNFAPTFPLTIGNNKFIIRYQNQEIQLNVNRLNNLPEIPPGLGFAKDSLVPNSAISRLPGEQICFSAIATPEAEVLVKLANKTIPLLSQSQTVKLPPNSAALTDNNRPIITPNIGQFEGCTILREIGQLGSPIFQAKLSGKTTTQAGLGTVEILSPAHLKTIEVIANSGVARTGPGTEYSRMKIGRAHV